MTVFWVLFIVFALPLIFCFVYAHLKNEWGIAIGFSIIFFTILTSSMLLMAIFNPILLKEEAIRQAKEREQIIYQIENLTENSDKIKLNEWILTYNDWVNNINTSKETYGWFSWYYDFDMTNHKIINLV